MPNQKDLFTSGQPQSIQAILANKERRANRQLTLSEVYQDGIIGHIALNIPGYIKQSPQITAVFLAGWRQFIRRLPEQVILFSEITADLPTGPEGFMVLNGQYAALKEIAIKFEAEFAFGRLFDIDLLVGKASTTHKISRTELGYQTRRCFVCDQDAKECARAQRHSKTEITNALNTMYSSVVDRESMYV